MTTITGTRNDKESSGQPEAVLETSPGNFFRSDGPAGTVVFLVALPLCLGIALASNAPLFSGLVAGIVGGILVSVLSGSHVSVTGPAAGLAVIVAGAIATLGSFPVFLAAVVLAGLLQIAMGLLRFGILADYVPNPVIRGMLAGIGVVIVLKQIPHALGRDEDRVSDVGFLLPQSSNMFTDIVSAVFVPHPGAVLISGLAILLMIVWDKVQPRMSGILGLTPGPLLAVALGTGLNELFRAAFGTLAVVDPEHLVQLPAISAPQEIFRHLTHPDFSRIQDPQLWIIAGTLAVVASIETLLNIEAADRLDPYHRITPTNRELFAQGVGNIVSGLLGGLPMTSVVVRTSANVFAGARTWMSSFIHGWLLLISVLFIPGLLNRIPLASLAAILILIGYKLARPALFRSMYAQGWNVFLPFAATVAGVVLLDLLKGVLIGFLVGVFFVIRTNHHAAITVVEQDRHYLVRFNKDASFVNKNALRSILRRIPQKSHVIIDATRALYIDRDIREIVDDYLALAPYQQVTVELRNF
ncbi:MAG: SulP family inorganic anion transporter [Bryobacteraceae bacterium]|nr:SulP family inorganic anion transporter [Bryobacteraceae bacterium]